MPKPLQETRDQLRSGDPGRRFQDLYERRQQSGKRTLKKTLFLGGGALVLAAGIFFLPAPGPGMVIVALGAGLMAQESRTAARALDWLEVKGRSVYGWTRRAWGRLPAAGKVAVALLATAAAAGAAYGAYQLLFG